MDEAWRDRPLAAPQELQAAAAELLRYTEDVEAGRRERVAAEPLKFKDLKLRPADKGGLTVWRGVLPILPHLALLGAFVSVAAGHMGPGEMVFRLADWAAPLTWIGDGIEAVFGWTHRYATGLPMLPRFPDGGLRFDLAQWSPMLAAAVFAGGIALVFGPTRSTFNRALILRDQLRRAFRSDKTP